MRITQPPVAISSTFAETEVAPHQLVVDVRILGAQNAMIIDSSAWRSCSQIAG